MQIDEDEAFQADTAANPEDLRQQQVLLVLEQKEACAAGVPWYDMTSGM